MKTTFSKLILAASFALALAFTVSCSDATANSASKAKNEHWEYTFFEGSDLNEPQKLTQEANKLGAEGWELVSAGGGRKGVFMIFKRRLP